VYDTCEKSNQQFIFALEQARYLYFSLPVRDCAVFCLSIYLSVIVYSDSVFIIIIIRSSLLVSEVRLKGVCMSLSSYC